MTGKRELAPEDLRRICDSKTFEFKTTRELEPLDAVIGQDRAVQAIEFGLNMEGPGYNIFVTGQEGTGKTTLVRKIVQAHAQNRETPADWCMVNNFADPYCPKAVAVPPGKAAAFAKTMALTIEDLKSAIPEALTSETFEKRRAEVQQRYNRRQAAVFKKIERFAGNRSLHISRTEAGFQTIPLIDGEPISMADFQKLPKAQRDAIEEGIRIVNEKIEEAAREINRITQSLHAEIEQMLDKETTGILRNRFDGMRKAYAACPDVLLYLDEVQTHIVENVQQFLPENSSGESASNNANHSFFKQFYINVLVDRSGTRGAPVVFEPNPTYANMFGQIEKRAHMGSVTTDFTMVQAGSLLQANGGYLIAEVEPVLTHNFVWDALKRSLQNKCLSIEDMASEYGFVTASLRPQPIPLEVKVILIGGYHPFQLLQAYDPKFNKIFRVRADFDHEVLLTPGTVHQYARYIASICHQDNLLPFTAKAVARVVEYGGKIVADKAKLSLRFGTLLGLIKEAEYWARKRNGRSVAEKDVQTALDEYRFRYNLYEEKIHESYTDNTILIDVDGAVVGQVNALAVYQIGELAFGRPSRITAETYMGKSGIVNIEREAKLSGKTHDKGVLILSGFLGRTFARHQPLNLSISITFEQSYGEIDGDSASSTELYAILSSLADVPIYQGIAVTGSVNQKGQVQAIGGANEKIEGFFEVCRSKGLTGRQGVLIPEANVKHLMLKKEVIDAVRRRRFHIYPVSRIDDGIEILTGAPAGAPDAAGDYPPDSIFGRAQSKLRDYFQRSAKMQKGVAESDEDTGSTPLP